MLNWHYVWLYNNEIYDDDILDIIMHNSFPMCLMHQNFVCNKTINEEFECIKTLIKRLNPDIKIVQIPRIIYDLYVIYFTILNDPLLAMNYNLMNIDYNNYLDYCKGINKKFVEFKSTILQLNNFIAKNLNNLTRRIDKHLLFELIIKTHNTLLDNYHNKIDAEMEANIDKINELDLQTLLNLTPLKLQMLIYNTFEDSKFWSMICLDLMRYYKKNNFDKINSKNIDYDLANFILKSENFINFQRYVQIGNNSLGLNNSFHLFEKIFDIEMNIDGKYHQSKFLLYRGTNDNFDSPIDTTNENKCYTLSYNLSVLNAFFSDKAACTFYYYTNGDYLIKKTMYVDRFTSNNDVFFIPPLHPYMQLFCYGEFWHARSKISKYSIITSSTGGTISSYVPDFLLTNLSISDLKIQFDEVAKNETLFGGKHNKKRYVLKYLY